MRWDPEEYPKRWERYEPQERREAIRVANQLVDDEGYEEENALRIAENQILSRNEGTAPQEGAQPPDGRRLENETAYEADPIRSDDEEQTQREHLAHGISPERDEPMDANRDEIEQWPRERLLEFASEQGLTLNPDASRNEIINKLSKKL